MSPNNKKPKIDEVEVIDVPEGNDLFADPVKLIVYPGKSISQILEDCNWGILNAPEVMGGRVFLNGDLIPKKKWGEVFPYERDTLEVAVIPTGDDNGDSSKVYRTVALIAVMAFAYYAGPAIAGAVFGQGAIATIAGGVIAGGVGIAGALAVNALIPPPSTSSQSTALGTSSYTSLLGINNAMKPYQPIQRLFGTHLIYPPYAIKPFTEVVGDKLIGYYVFAVGPGDYSTASMKIGNTDLTSFTEYTVQEGFKGDIDIFSRGDIDETDLAIEVLNSGGPYTQSSAVDVNELSVDLTCTGLYGIDEDDGDVKSRTVNFTVEYRPTGSAGAWTPFDGGGNVSRKKQERFTINYTKTGLATDQYDVRITRNTADDSSPTGASGYAYVASTFYWTKFRSVAYTEPWTLDNIYLISLKIRLDGQISGGGVNTFNLIASSKLEAYNGTSWNAAAVTRSPAWVFTSVLRDESNRRAVSDSEIDVDEIKDWADECTAANYYLDGIVEQHQNIWDLLHEIAAVGRGVPGRTVDGKWTVIRDITQTTRVQKITPLNSWDFGGRKAFQDIPHAIKCRFINSAKNYQQDEMIVYRDTYNAGNSTLFETMDFRFVTTSDHVWKLARYHFGQAIYRPEVFNVSMDFEHIANGMTRGKLVGFSYDAILVGLGSALVTSLTLNGSLECTSVTMNNFLTMEAGKTYGASIRRSVDGREIAASITLNVGKQTTIAFNPVIPAADVPSVGDLLNYGETGEIQLDCLVQGIRPINETDAVISLVEDAPSVRTYDAGTPPAHTSKITHPGEVNELPYAPSIEGVSVIPQLIKTGDLAGQIQLIVSVDFSVDSTSGIYPVGYQAMYFDQEDTDGDWVPVEGLILPELRSFKVEVQNGKTYDFRVRGITKYGEVSTWSSELDYTVNYTELVPLQITSLDLIPTGSTWAGVDCNIIWANPVDIWQVRDIKIEIYKTSPLTLLRTDKVRRGVLVYTYKFSDNIADNNGTPIGGLTFRVSSISWLEQEGSYAQKAVTHTSPTSITSLSGESRLGGVEFTWDGNTDAAFSHFEYRLKVESEAWSAFKITSSNSVLRMLTTAEKTTYGADASIYIEVKAVDVFGNETSTSSTNTSAGDLYVAPADITDIGPFASKLFPFVPVVIGLVVTDNSNNGTPGSASGYIHWSSFTIYHDEVEYTIATGYTNSAYIVWKDLASSLTAISVVPEDNYADWKPKEDFLMLYNDSGSHQKAWETLVNAVIGTAHIAAAAVDTAQIADAAIETAKINNLAVTEGKIANLAVTNAKINSLDAGKITTGTISADRIGAASLVISKMATDVTDRLFTSSTRSFDDIGGASKPDDNATKNTIYRQSAQPAGTSGDIWFDTDDNKLYRHNGSAWEDISASSAMYFPADEDLVAYYACDDGAGATVLTDQTTYGNDGAITSLGSGAGISGYSVDNSDGSQSKYAIMPGDSEPLQSLTDLGNDYSISLWANFHGLPQLANDGYLIVRSISGSYRCGIYHDKSTGKIEAHFSEDDLVSAYAMRTLQSDILPTYGQWYHIVLAVGAASANLYVQGGLVDTYSRSWANYDFGTSDWGIGGSTSGRNPYAKVDQIRFFSKQLSPEEVLALFAFPGGPSNSISWNLVFGQNKPADNATSNVIYRQTGQPATGSEGDLWFDTDDDLLYRHNGSIWEDISANSPSEWADILDTAGTKPDDNATQNTIYRQSAQPTGSIGDIWLDTDDGKLYRHNGSSWDLIGTEDSSWRHVSDQTKIDGGNIYASTITATQLNVSTLSAITANVGTLTSGTIRSSDSRFKIDLANKLLTINDGSYDRVEIGYIT